MRERRRRVEEEENEEGRDETRTGDISPSRLTFSENK